MSGFTPGPWHTESRQASGKNDFAVSPANGNDGFVAALTHGPDSEANARLIAAAPELYEALDNLLRLFPVTVKGPAVDAIIDAGNALAKARGEQA